MLSELLSAVIFGVFMLFLVVGAISTAVRWLRYMHAKLPVPLLLKRDTALLGGLSFPFLLISAVRALGLSAVVTNAEGPTVWWLLLTGLPAIFAVGVYAWFEIFVIEKPPKTR